MHQIIDMEVVEDRDGRYRMEWTCDCGRRGSGATQKAAVAGGKRHVLGATRKEYYR